MIAKKNNLILFILCNKFVLFLKGANVTNICLTLQPLLQNSMNMAFKMMNAGQKDNYIAPAIEKIDFQSEQAVLASSGVFGLPGEEPGVNDFGEF